MATDSALQVVFAHHTWATLALIDSCARLGDDQLRAPVAGVYGPVLDTLRHFIGNEAFDLAVVQGNPSLSIEAASLDLGELKALAETNGRGWQAILVGSQDVETMMLEVDPDDGYRREATLGLRLAQALHHANEHRTQVCSSLSMLGLDPPHLSAFDYGSAMGQIREVFPTEPGSG